METTQNNDLPEGHGFSDYEILKEVEEEREEEFYIPDRRFSASQREGKNQYSIDRFTGDGAGNYECPAGKAMEYKRRISYEDCYEPCVG